MDKFIIHCGIAAPILRANVDTDAIIPSREMKRVSKDGLGEGLFAGWRYLQAGKREVNPEFVLNQAEYQNTSILLAGENFGCGSSREHAVWALKEYGIRAILAPSFGSIFYINCIANGLLPIRMREDLIKSLAEQVEKNPQEQKVTINLEEAQVVFPNQDSAAFEIDKSHQNMLLSGKDAIDLTLEYKTEIEKFEQQHRISRPWLTAAFK